MAVVITPKPNYRKLHLINVKRTVSLQDQQKTETLTLGDITAFEMLFRTYYQSLCHYAYTFLQDRQDAEEVVQSAFVLMWEKRDALDIHTAVKPYLYATVRNACLNVLKRERVKQKYLGEELVLAERSHDAVSQEIDSKELANHIQTAIEGLPEQCRMVFKLSRFEQLRYSEIARELNISVKTVENHMGKALRIMREQLSEYLPALFIILNGILN